MPPIYKASKTRGSSLIEAVIAMGVLAVAIPLVFGALAEAGKSGIVVRGGNPQHLDGSHLHG